MRTGISLSVTPADLDRLRALVRDRNAPQKHVWRAQIVLFSAEGAGTNAIMRETGKSKTCIWRWQERFAAEGVDGLLRDKTRPSRIPKLDSPVAERVVALAMEAPPHEATHWTRAAMAEAAGVSVSSVQRIWRAHGLQPHRVWQFKLSNDPAFAEKLRDIVGLYVDPPAHAVVLSVDEKSQIQALDRTQPGLPLKKGRAGTMTQAERDDDPVRGVERARRNRDRPEHAAPPASGTHSLPQRRRARSPRRQNRPRDPRQLRRPQAPGQCSMAGAPSPLDVPLHPDMASWLNAVEGFFAILTKRQLKRGVFRSVTDLHAAINRFLEHHNDHAKPFQWVAEPDKIIAAVRRGHQVLNSIH